ncbi:WG repeat-containing protein [Pedobacter hiemivivus]|uniref:WG repeat-containing protein n=1 Tax=Pedobacter hiemivivus TaxID=2530454 RepID=A0A4R0NFD6_9SPHI|nr:WG repeat-containing protein [Pedobacter hiemivivus]TCC99171.1 WG repeat-containing protein [Pedobacter hiemivivus]
MTKQILIMSFLTGLLGVFGCNNKPKEDSDKEQFEEILNDPRVNSREVGEREGIKYFQVIKDGKVGFRNLDGNIVIESKFDSAEMFSEGVSTVQLGEKYGMIDEKGNYVLQLMALDYLGSLHNGLASFLANDKYGFVNAKGQEVIKPKYDWVDEFSEGLCVVRNDMGKHGYIDTIGKVVVDLQFQYASKFEKGQAKIEINNLWGAINKSGKIIEEATHKYSTW